jgi:hypothetical protein
MGGDGEIYVLSKTDGMIRQLVAAPTVTLVASDPTATEAAVTTGHFVVMRTGSTTSSLAVNYSVTGTASPSSDYTPLTGAVTIPIGAVSARITVRPVNDTVVEPNETVAVSLARNGPYAVGSPHSATVTIVSDDVASPRKDVSDRGPGSVGRQRASGHGDHGEL